MASVQSQNLFALLQDDVTEVNTVKAPPPKAAPVAAAPAPKKEAPKAAAPAKKEGMPIQFPIFNGHLPFPLLFLQNSLRVLAPPSTGVFLVGRVRVSSQCLFILLAVVLCQTFASSF